MAPPTTRRAVALVTASTLLAAHSALSAVAPAADMAAPPVAQAAPPRGVPFSFPTTTALSGVFCFARPAAAAVSCAGGQGAPGVPPRGRPLLPGRHRRVDAHGRSVDHYRQHLSCRQRTGGDHPAAVRVARPHRDAGGDRVAHPHCIARTTAPHWWRRRRLFRLNTHLATCGPPLMESTARTAPPRRLPRRAASTAATACRVSMGGAAAMVAPAARAAAGGMGPLLAAPVAVAATRGRVGSGGEGGAGCDGGDGGAAADGGDRGDGGESGVGGSGGGAGDGGSGGDVPGGRSGRRGAEGRDGQPGRPGRTAAA